MSARGGGPGRRGRAGAAPRAAARHALLDRSLAFALEGYGFTSRRVRRWGGDAVETRLLGLRTLLVLGEEAARVLYDGARFTRRGAMPRLVRTTLLGTGGVQGLDGAAHHARKAVLLSLLGPDRAPGLAEGFVARWRAALPRWERAGRVVLLDEAAELLCRTVCAWAGVPLPEEDVARRTRQLRQLFEAPGDPRLGYPRARLARLRAQAWVAGLVDAVREGTLRPGEGTALHVLATHREADGGLLDRRTAAVELLNVLRPTVAISRYVVFAALALHEHPRWREELRQRDDDVLPFVHEVRRYHPFFPVVAARVREPFTWRGLRLPRGRRVVLDVHGTDHDPRSWEDPAAFRPERFRGGVPSAFAFVPQGGGDHATGHRCAGEWVTVEVVAAAVRLLAREVEYEVPEQDLTVSTRRMPTGPRSGFVLEGVRAPVQERR
ncbi:cytochrome P450 [Kineococcus glutinatus]|uniref:Fatty-acid peroxygenase n=1 Tax=Kineococcus glutinatus TaxID=1070872 RepID=A0ABP9I7Z8_9ACTN